MKWSAYPVYRESGVEWLPEIPESWRVLPIRGLARHGIDTFIDGDWVETPFITDDGVRLIQTGNIGIGVYREQGYRYISEASFHELNCTEVEPGNVLICRLAEPVGRACIAPDLGVRMITSVDICILKVADTVHAPFIVYLLSSAQYLGFMESVCRGGTRDRVSRSFLGSVRVAVPTFDEQRPIAAFLDHETAKLDTLIAKEKRLIALLQEKRQAVIADAVTKGVNLVKSPMKDSGLEWIGKVPSHWDIVRLGTVFRQVAEPGNEGLPVLTVSIHDGVSDREFDDDELTRKVSRSEDRSKYIKVQPGDLVYNMMRAWQGGFGAVIVTGMVSPAYVVARPRGELSTPYIELLLRTPQAIEKLRLHSRGVTDFRLRLYWDEFKDIKIALPPLAEQQEIVAAVVSAEGKIANLIEKCRRSIDLMLEHRTAIISAAVAGKIDVRACAEASPRKSAVAAPAA